MHKQSKQSTTVSNLAEQVTVDEQGKIVVDVQKLMKASAVTTKKPTTNRASRSVNWIR